MSPVYAFDGFPQELRRGTKAWSFHFLTSHPVFYSDASAQSAAWCPICLSQIWIWWTEWTCFLLQSLCLILTDCSFYNVNGHKLVLGFPVSWPLPPGATLNWGWWFTKQNFIQHRVWYVGLWSCGGLADLSEWWPWWVCCIWCCLNSCLEHQCGEMSTEFISQENIFKYYKTRRIPHHRLDFFALLTEQK